MSIGSSGREPQDHPVSSFATPLVGVARRWAANASSNRSAAPGSSSSLREAVELLCVERGRARVAEVLGEHELGQHPPEAPYGLPSVSISRARSRSTRRLSVEVASATKRSASGSSVTRLSMRRTSSPCRRDARRAGQRAPRVLLLSTATEARRRHRVRLRCPVGRAVVDDDHVGREWASRPARSTASSVAAISRSWLRTGDTVSDGEPPASPPPPDEPGTKPRRSDVAGDEADDRQGRPHRDRGSAGPRSPRWRRRRSRRPPLRQARSFATSPPTRRTIGPTAGRRAAREEGASSAAAPQPAAEDRRPAAGRTRSLSQMRAEERRRRRDDDRLRRVEHALAPWRRACS